MTFIEIAEAFLNAVKQETDEWVGNKGIVVPDEENQKVTLFTASHLQFARYGRGPGKRPPLDPILEWVKANGIVTDDKEARGAAFAIQNSIGLKGTKNFVPNAPDFLEEVINKNLEKYYKDISGVILVEQTKEINNIFNTQFPEVIKIKI